MCHSGRVSDSTGARDLTFLAVAFAVLALAVGILGVLALGDRDVRGTASSTPVWLTAMAAVPWLVAAAVTAWSARSGGLSPGLPITLALLVAWVVTTLVAAGGGTASGWFGIPLLLAGIVPVLFLVMLVQAARR
jgi:hypothetical protein